MLEKQKHSFYAAVNGYVNCVYSSHTPVLVCVDCCVCICVLVYTPQCPVLTQKLSVAYTLTQIDGGFSFSKGGQVWIQSGSD